MYYKKIVPIQVLNLYATEFVGEFPLVSRDGTSRLFEIEFYDHEGQPLISRKGKISGLPVNAKLVENINTHAFDYNSQEAREMFEAQDKIIFDKIKEICGLTYYDDFYEINNRTFSYRTYINAGNPHNIEKYFK